MRASCYESDALCLYSGSLCPNTSGSFDSAQRSEVVRTIGLDYVLETQLIAVVTPAIVLDLQQMSGGVEAVYIAEQHYLSDMRSSRAGRIVQRSSIDYVWDGCPFTEAESDTVD